MQVEYGAEILDPHPIEEQIDHFGRNLRMKNRVRVVNDADLILGFMASTPESMAQLYVRVGHHRRGIERQLLSEV